MKTYWQAETCDEHGALADIDFPARDTRAEAVADAAQALDRADDERITAFVCEWTGIDGWAENTGQAVQVDRDGNVGPIHAREIEQ